jgi:hypothetical protein
MLDGVISGKKSGARRILYYSVEGFGKTTLGTMARNPIFIQAENGADDHDVPRWPVASSFDEILGRMRQLIREEHDRKTCVIDTGTSVERLIHEEVAKKNEVASIADIDYGKGYEQAVEYGKKFLTGVNALRDAGIDVMLLCHVDVKKFSEPGKVSYDKYQPRMHAKLSALLFEAFDEVLFGNYSTRVRREDLGFKKTRAFAVGGSERVIFTQGSASCMAKRRLLLPDEIVLDEDTLGANFWDIYNAARRGETVGDDFADEGGE